MRLIYNGVELKVLHLQELSRDAVYSDDGVDYLYTRVQILATALVNGEVDVQDRTIGTSYREDALLEGNPEPLPQADLKGEPPSAVPVPPLADMTGDPSRYAFIQDYIKTHGFLGQRVAIDMRGNRLITISPVKSTAVLTDKAIRTRLLLPRGKLYLFSGEVLPTDNNFNPEELLLESPPKGATVDCRAGPYPRVYSIQESIGDARSFFVSVQFETYLNEINESTDTQPALISNRFTMKHTINENYLTAIDVAGEALFRMDILQKKRINPDQLRPFLLLPIPSGFQRTNIVIETIPNITGVRYTFTDEERPITFVGANEVGATQIEAIHSQSIVCDQGILTGVMGAVEKAANSMWAIKSGFGKDKDSFRVPVHSNFRRKP